jgi:hypothetical protein
VAISGRIGAAGIFAAYGAGTNPFDATPALWQVGAGKAKLVKGEKDGEHTILAPAQSGRLWMAWDRDERIRALRTNGSANKFGAVVQVKPPAGTDTIYGLAGEGSGGGLDILALVDTGQTLGYWHRRILPGLTLVASPKKVEAGKKVTLTVTDAGSPVNGATTKLALPGKDSQGKTNASGKAKLAVPKGTKPGRYKATAGAPGYAAGKTKVRIK